MDTSVSAVSVVGKIVPSSTLPTKEFMPLPIVGNPDPPKPVQHKPPVDSAPVSASPPAWVTAAHAAEAAGAHGSAPAAAQDATQAPQAVAVAQAAPVGYGETRRDPAEPHPIATV